MNTISRNGYEFSVQHCMEITVWRVRGEIQRWFAATVKPLRRVSKGVVSKAEQRLLYIGNRKDQHK